MQFPYVLPNVWLPTRPIVDVMDEPVILRAGNYAFLHVFNEWIKVNIRCDLYSDQGHKGEWNEDLTEPSIGDILYKPVTTLQYNFMQDYMQESMASYSAFFH
jgi:hypothetical protein